MMCLGCLLAIAGEASARISPSDALAKPAISVDYGTVLVPKEAFPRGGGLPIPIYVPPVVGSSNASSGDWKTVGEISGSQVKFSQAKLLANLARLALSSPNSGTVAAPGGPEIDTGRAAAFSVAAGLIGALSNAFDDNRFRITVQEASPGGRLRSIVEISVGEGDALRSNAGGVINSPDESSGAVAATAASDWLLQRFALPRPRRFYEAFWLIDKEHAKDAYIAYLALLPQSSAVLIVPKIYPGDRFKVQDRTNLLGGRTALDLSGQTYVGAWSYKLPFGSAEALKILELLPLSPTAPGPQVPSPAKPAAALDLSGRWTGIAVRQPDGRKYQDTVTIVQTQSRIYQVRRRHDLSSSDYNVVADDIPAGGYSGEWNSSGSPPPHILEQRGSWTWSIHDRRWVSNNGHTINWESSFANGQKMESAWHRVAALATMPKIGEVVHECKGLVKLGEEVSAGELKVQGTRDYLLLVLNYPGSKLDLIVTDPAGNLLKPDSPGVTYLAKEIPARLYILHPTSGLWRFKVKGIQVEGDAEPFWLIGTYTNKGPNGQIVTPGGGGLILAAPRTGEPPPWSAV